MLTDSNNDLKIALTAARAAGKIQMQMQPQMQSSAHVQDGGNGLTIEIKEDKSPVTNADKLCEEKIKKIINENFPNDTFLGEESGTIGDLNNSRRWIVDPIDGTRPFIRGIPTHSVLVALEENGEPTVGVIHLPAMGLTCYASKNNGAFLENENTKNVEQIRVSKIKNLQDAMGSTLGIVEYANEKRGQQLLNFMKSLDYVYGFMDAYSYVLLACGKIDACVNLLDKPWDCAAAACIITEAGGKFSDVNGAQTIHAGSFVATNGALHESVIKILNS